MILPQQPSYQNHRPYRLMASLAPSYKNSDARMNGRRLSAIALLLTHTLFPQTYYYINF